MYSTSMKCIKIINLEYGGLFSTANVNGLIDNKLHPGKNFPNPITNNSYTCNYQYY